MRILITGGCGFLGSHLVEHFLKATDADTEIVILDKLTYASGGFDRLRDIAVGMGGHLPERLKVLGCDLSQPVSEGVVREIGQVDYVIHAAAESHVDNSIVDPLPFLQSNVIGTHHLLWMLLGLHGKCHGVRRIFCVSTDEVYGPAPQRGCGTFASGKAEKHEGAVSAVLALAQRYGGAQLLKHAGGPDAVASYEDLARAVWPLREQLLFAGYDEEARFRPANPYAASKAGGEAVAMAYANTYKLPITIVNTMNLIGERQHREKFVPMTIRKVLDGDTVTIHADATQTRAGSRFYLHCRTFANALAWLIQKDAETHAAGLGTWQSELKLHVCGEREIDNLDLARLIASYVGKPFNYELVDFHSSRPGHDLRYAMDDDLIRQMGWERPMNLEQSLEKTVRWFLANPRWLGL